MYVKAALWALYGQKITIGITRSDGAESHRKVGIVQREDGTIVVKLAAEAAIESESEIDWKQSNAIIFDIISDEQAEKIESVREAQEVFKTQDMAYVKCTIVFSRTLRGTHYVNVDLRDLSPVVFGEWIER